MIIGKSVIVEQNLKVRTGYKIPLELQLYDEFDTMTANDLLKIITSVDDICIEHVHMPLRKPKRSNIETLNSSKCKNDFENTLNLAGLLSEYYNKNIVVVIHLGLDSRFVINNYTLFGEIIRLFEKNIAKYPLVTYAIENVTLIEDPKTFMLATNLFDEALPLITKLNDYFYKPDEKYFGTVLDTCHAMSTIRAFKLLYSDYPEFPIFTMDDYFNANKDTIKLIHLADVTNLGLRKEEHGIVFTDENVMKGYVDLYKKYNYSCNVVLEIREDDYTCPKNLFNNYNMLTKLMED